jgi:hypothetical protein
MAIIEALSAPIMFLNMFGGIIAGIWLIIIGKWAALGIAIASAFVSHFAIGFTMLPAGFISAIAFTRLKKGTGILGHFILLCASIYTFAILWYWSVFIFGVFHAYIGPNGAGKIPLMLMAYSVATAPVGYLASKEGDSPATTIATFCTMLGCMIFMMSQMFNVHHELGSLVFMGIMAIGVFIQLVISVQFSTAMRIEEQLQNDYLNKN